MRNPLFVGSLLFFIASAVGCRTIEVATCEFELNGTPTCTEFTDNRYCEKTYDGVATVTTLAATAPECAELGYTVTCLDVCFESDERNAASEVCTSFEVQSEADCDAVLAGSPYTL